MSKRAFSRAFDMPTIDPDKEDEVMIREYYATLPDGSKKHHIKLPDGHIVECPVVAKSGCDHSWTSYTGLSESFEYCIHCDEKR